MLRSVLIVSALACAVALTGCGKATAPTVSSMDSMTMSSDPMPAGNGTQSSWTGYTLVPTATTPTQFAFHITGPDGKPVTTFEPDQTKLMHVYLIRDDLSGYQHVHPTMATDGTWTADLATLTPGAYRAYTTFTTPDASGKPIAFALSVPITVPGTATTTPLPAPAPSTTVDGYTLTLSGEPMAGMADSMSLHVAKNGQPVTDLQPYLDTYAHLSAFHAGDLAFAHLHPGGAVDGDHGGPDLTFDAEFSASGTWRVYVQFQTGGVLHTAGFTVAVG
ncbi:MAG TPA: hypothetical protein VJ914_31495 [Pseudonocardiaceae bacterium]|nr:hypothetical protein [Pseudonocardiaceae bacterium]